MAKKGGADGNSKKAAGQARKADTAAKKTAAAEADKEVSEAREWDKGAKSSSKKEAEAAKKEELARKKAEREALLAEEEKNTPGRSAPKNSKSAPKKTRGLDLSQLDSDGGGGLAALSASGIDNALDALSLTSKADAKIDRHPERRYKAAYTLFEARRLTEMDEDGSGAGLRQNQKKERIKKEFERSPENPFNQLTARYDTSKEELAELKEQEKTKIETRLTAGLKQACPQGIYVSLTPGDPTLWSGVLFVRAGPYAPAILRFQISFPDTYPALPPLVTFATDMFHPLLTPLTTYMYSTDVQDGGTVSAFDEERLPPGGFSLRQGFADWFGRGRRAQQQQQQQAAALAQRGAAGGGDAAAAATTASTSSGGVEVMTPTRAVATATGMTPGSAASAASSSASAPGYARTGGKEVSTYEVLRYIRSAFDDEDVLDAVPLEAAGNPGAWHAWRTHRKQATAGKALLPSQGGNARVECESQPETAPAAVAAAGTTRRPGEWNWEGVWEERVKRGIAASLSEGVLFGNAGTTDEVINFLSMDDADVEGVKSNLLRTLGATA
ncbi:hypothetical protein C8A00DRAFT_45500 [Chaetomidium leptoderma]|uniref:UBC core domain-containing protein n=1 Tax=Chaetomidium leptoderma TaxID=669021 RepID=A0AAN6ZUZ5_9PEZI|nr:hypothetical protein C8A00DRAFT_45500 [Chaetomidium leptoderma]